MNKRPTPIYIEDDQAADLLGTCDICDADHVVCLIGGQAVCASEQCAAEALNDMETDA